MNCKQHLAIKLIKTYQWTNLSVDDVSAQIKGWHSIELPGGSKRLAVECGTEWYLVDNTAPRDSKGKLILS